MDRNRGPVLGCFGRYLVIIVRLITRYYIKLNTFTFRYLFQKNWNEEEKSSDGGESKKRIRNHTGNELKKKVEKFRFDSHKFIL